MNMPREGQKAPQFTLKDANGKEVSLKDYAGKNRVILYFYPKDDTPGCTVEACGFRDEYKKFTEKGAVVLGVSPDDEKSHAKFVEKFKLPFRLLADTDKEVVQKYGVWGEKQFMGKKYMGVSRTTFLIAKDGTIEKVFEKVKPDEHADELLEILSK